VKKGKSGRGGKTARDEQRLREHSIKELAHRCALELIVCQHLGWFYSKRPPEDLTAATRAFLESAQRQTFPGIGAAYSDHFAAELEDASRQIFEMIAEYERRLR
jgi:hypothetical protein